MPGSETDVMGGIVLTGGRAARLQGADKASIEIAGATLLEHALGALAEVPEVVVVGDEVHTSRPVTWLAGGPPDGVPPPGCWPASEASRRLRAGRRARRGHAAGHRGDACDG